MLARPRIRRSKNSFQNDGSTLKSCAALEVSAAEPLTVLSPTRCRTGAEFVASGRRKARRHYGHRENLDAIGAAYIDCTADPFVVFLDRIVECDELSQLIGILWRRQIATVVVVTAAFLAYDIKEIAPHHYPLAVPEPSDARTVGLYFNAF